MEEKIHQLYVHLVDPQRRVKLSLFTEFYIRESISRDELSDLSTRLQVKLMNKTAKEDIAAIIYLEDELKSTEGYMYVGYERLFRDPISLFDLKYSEYLKENGLNDKLLLHNGWERSRIYWMKHFTLQYTVEACYCSLHLIAQNSVPYLTEEAQGADKLDYSEIPFLLTNTTGSYYVYVSHGKEKIQIGTIENINQLQTFSNLLEADVTVKKP